MKKDKRKSDSKAAARAPKPTGRFIAQRLFWLLGKHGRIFIEMAGICVFAWIIGDALKSFAGKQSFADLRFGIFGDIRFVYTISMAVGATGTALYLRERSLHRKTRERLATRITDLEKQIDPARTSSLLTSLGMTRQEDE